MSAVDDQPHPPADASRGEAEGGADPGVDDGDGPGVGPGGVDPDLFHALYDQGAPWDIGEPQPEVVRLLELHRFRSPILDIGCGSGENSVLLAMAAYDVTGIDLVPRAIDQAQELADERHIEVDFKVADALTLADAYPQGAFDTVLDSGVLHVFSDADRRRYAEVLRHLVAPDGWLHVIVFSDEEAGSDGPRRLSRDELRACFSEGWEEVDIVATHYGIRTRQHGAKAWRGTWRRTGFRTR